MKIIAVCFGYRSRPEILVLNVETARNVLLKQCESIVCRDAEPILEVFAPHS
jgi:hypothetical protein